MTNKSDEDANPKHRRNSWSEVVRGLTGAGGGQGAFPNLHPTLNGGPYVSSELVVDYGSDFTTNQA